MRFSYYQINEPQEDLGKDCYSHCRNVISALPGRVSSGISYVSSLLKKRYSNSSVILRYGRKRRPRLWSSAKNCGYCGSETMGSGTTKSFGMRRVIIAHCQNCGAAA